MTIGSGHTGPMVHSLLHGSQFNAVNAAAADTKTPVWDAAVRGHQRTQQTKRVDAIRRGQAQRQAERAAKPAAGSASPKMTEGAGPIHPTLSPQPPSGRHAGGEAAPNPGYAPRHGAKVPTPAPAVPVTRKANAGARVYSPPPTWRQESSPGVIDFNGASNAGPSPVRAARPSQTSMDFRRVAPHTAPVNPRMPLAADPEGRPDDFGSAFQAHPVPWDSRPNPSGQVVNHKQAMFAGTGIPTAKAAGTAKRKAAAADSLTMAQHAHDMKKESVALGYKTEGKLYDNAQNDKGRKINVRPTKAAMDAEGDAAQKHAWEEQKRSGQ